MGAIGLEETMLDENKKRETKVHICPVLMRTVIFNENGCTERCTEDCPIMARENDGLQERVQQMA